MNLLLLKKQLQDFLIEDIGTGDLSSSLFDEQDITTATMIAKENGVFAGCHVLSIGYGLIDSEVETEIFVKDGDLIKEGTILAEIKGKRASLLTAKISDTRKTTPGLRMLEKYAVRCGGGYNHRMGLYDTVMLKDNHLAGFSSIQEAVAAVRKTLGHTVKIEVETETEEQVIQAVEAGADIIMFDNCTPEEIKQRLQFVPPAIITEASGGICMEEIEAFSNTGVQFLSLGFLTHSYTALDISLNLKGAVKHDYSRNLR
jgi:nicotinate-nucleotide pyrophosphorylase (carboxylating)